MTFAYWLNLYDLPAHLLQNPQSDKFLGLCLSDAVIFPLLSIIFCYYSTQYRRPWTLSLISSLLMGIIEYYLEKQGFMVSYHWSHWVTVVLTFFGCRILAHFASKFIYYSPPSSYRFWLVGMIYSVSEPTGALLGWGFMHLFQHRPNIFDNYTADDRTISFVFTTVIGGCLAYFAPKIHPQSKFFLFMGLSINYILFDLWLYSRGWLIYYHWNHGWTVARYLTTCLLMLWIDKWESTYRSARKQYAFKSGENLSSVK